MKIITKPLRWDLCGRENDHPAHEGGDGTWNCVGRAHGEWNRQPEPQPVSVHQVAAVKLTARPGGGQQLLVTDDAGRVFDFSGAVFDDNLAIRKVGETDGFRQYGLDVTMVLSPGSDTSLAEPLVTEAIPVAVDTVPPVDPDERPELRERFVRQRGEETTVIGITDDEDGNEKTECTIPMETMRRLLMDAGYERDYVRDDVELDRVRQAAADARLDADVAAGMDATVEGRHRADREWSDALASRTTEAIARVRENVDRMMAGANAKGRPFPGWDDATVDEVSELARQAGTSFLILDLPDTPRGILLRTLHARIRQGRDLMASTTSMIEGLTEAQSQRVETESSVLELVGTINALDGVERP